MIPFFYLQVYLLHKEQSIPIITAIISMPVSEGIIME